MTDVVTVLEQNNAQDKISTRKISKAAVVGASVFGGLAVSISIAALPFVSPAFRKICLPYVPATSQQISNILRALNTRRGTLIDLGSGDGRVVIAAAKTGAFRHASGIELNPWLSIYSSLSAWKQGLLGKASFKTGSLWKINFQSYDNIVIFGVPSMMSPLQEKLRKEMSKDARVVACRFPFDEWTPLGTYGEGIDTVWVYKKPTSTDQGERS